MTNMNKNISDVDDCEAQAARLGWDYGLVADCRYWLSRRGEPATDANVDAEAMAACIRESDGSEEYWETISCFIRIPSDFVEASK